MFTAISITALLVGLALSAACAFIAKRFLKALYEENYRPAVWLKGAAGACFVLVGLIMALGNPSPYAWKVLAGLALGLIGDELLALRFVHKKSETLLFAAGALTFAIGHGFYLWALFGLGGAIMIKAVAIAAVGCALSALYNRKKGSDAGELMAAAIGYIALVVFMGSVACAAALTGFGVRTLLFALGGICFVLSDNILIAYSFGKDRRFLLNTLVHVTYYAAQLFIAWSIAF